MEQIYALGISIIEFIQDWFADNEWYIEIVNTYSNPHAMTEYLFPIISTIDSVFGAQLLLCMTFGGWLNCLIKWWLQEDRPYWWVRETTYYSQTDRPMLRQTCQTCETGPGSPSGHSLATATLILLVLMWTKHVMHDRKCYFWWWKYLMYPLSIFTMGSVMVSRLYTASHFPHQCLMGALMGSFLAPAICIYVSDPYIWRYGAHVSADPRRARSYHVIAALSTVALSVMAYYLQVLLGHDPQHSVKLAFRWCASPEHIYVQSTPIYSLVYCTGSLLGLALSVTPDIAEYRHYTKNRSLLLCAMFNIITVAGSRHVLDNLCKSNTFRFFMSHFIVAALKPMLLLRVGPKIAMWPYEKPKQKIQ